MVLVGLLRCLKDMFNASDLIMAEETGLEVVRSMPKPVPEKKNNYYSVLELPISVPHDRYSVDISTFFSVVNYVKLFPATSEYQYSVNDGDWIIVGSGNQIELEDFETESLVISNVAGAGILRIYLEGVGV